MLTPLQLSVPESAQVHIHLAPPSPFGVPLGSAGPDATRQPVEPMKRHSLRLALAALLAFGGGYMARSLSTPNANAQGPSTASLGLPPPLATAEPPVGGVPGMTPGLPSSIQLRSLPSPYPVLPNQVPGQPSGLYPVQPQRPLPGMAVRAPFPVPPNAPSATGEAAPPATATPTLPRNPFGLE